MQHGQIFELKTTGPGGQRLWACRWDFAHPWVRPRGISCCFLERGNGEAAREATRLKHRVLSEALWREHHEDSDHGRSGDKQKPVTAERVAASESADPARIVELREELRERAAARRWRAQQARRSGRQLYSQEQVAHALALVAEGKSLHEAVAAVGATHTTVMRWRRRAA